MTTTGNPFKKHALVWQVPVLVTVVLWICSNIQENQHLQYYDENQPVTLALLGDIMLGRGVARAYISDTGEAESWSNALEGLRPVLQTTDFTAANLESPVSSQISKQSSTESDTLDYNLCASPESIDAIVTANLHLATLANNHSHDCSSSGPGETAQYLQQAGIAYLEQGQVYRHSVDGMPLVFLAYDDISSPVDTDTMLQQINHQYLAGYIVIVSIHWGREYQPIPNERQIKLAKMMADAGAAIIWGHHPHVLQPVEWMQGEDMPYRTLVAYSLGNTLFDQAYPKSLRQSAILVVTFADSQVQSFETIPIEILMPDYRTVLIEQ